MKTWVLGLLGVALVSMSSPADAACSGYYAFIPPDGTSSVGFSLEVKPTTIKTVFMDYSGNTVSRFEQVRPGVLRFKIDNGRDTILTCTADRASVEMAQDRAGPVRTYRLFRSQGDIFWVARSRGLTDE